MCSYRKEVLANDVDYNAVTVVMYNNNVDVDGAIQWISDRHDDIVESFMKTRDDVLNHKNGFPSWGENIDRQLALYVDGLGMLLTTPNCVISNSRLPLGQWIRGHDEWNFGSGRYFGDKGLHIQKTRQVFIE